ncbi:PREDICTED: uncharacterized protein LOC105361874 [Ceratosolen solmsi marchali]|uniref:Uncharacterized protein LOC105361874 n=1 Tax=Ceratosolen solmsi marchali TaxID=326594 RepID=A0AAJ6YG66_9HYME|nr:PREDICTED: uncharacterized protein LOC105361874 [Ceratosolen solmsi marchali]
MSNNEINLKQELKDMFVYKVNIKLTIINSAAVRVSKNLSGIAEHLQGDQLEEEIKRCIQDENQCNIRNEYLVKINSSEKYIQILIRTISSVLDQTLKSEISKIVPEKINIQIYLPIMRCLNHTN